MPVYGRCEVAVDERNRIILPSRLLEQEKIEKLYLLQINPEDPAFEIYSSAFCVLPYTYFLLFLSLPQIPNKDVQWLINQAKPIFPDGQNRILISGLKKYGQRVYLLGQGDKIEVWPIEEYKKRVENIHKVYNRLSSFSYDA